MDTIFVLNVRKQVIDILSNNGSDPAAPFFDDTYISELDTGAETYEFTTFANARTVVALEVGNFILFKYDGKYKLFQITSTEEEHSEGKKLITCYCEMGGMELLNDYCEPFSLEADFVTFMNTVLQDTYWTLGRYSESLATNMQKVELKEHSNVYGVIQENLATFGGVEIEFRVEFSGNQLVGQYIDCYENGDRGNIVGRRFEYGTDVKGITRTRNIDDLATALIGVGKNDINFKDVEWKKSKGDPCDKPLGQNFVADDEANDIWNNNGKYIKSLYKSEAESPADLLQETWDKLQEVKQPKFDYEVDLALVVEDYQDIRIGDTNYIVDFDYQPAILLEARVGTLEISFANPINNKCRLTNYKELTSIILPALNTDMVDSMIESKFPIGGDKIQDGAIGKNHLQVTFYQALKVEFLEASLAQVDTLIANKVDTEQLNATNAEIDNLKANKANITDLTATNVKVENLNANVANINTIINGHFTGDDAQILNITAANTNIDNAVIKNAMIDTISANKMNTGTLNTNNVVIQSQDGGILLSGSTQQFKDKDGNVRVQIGKDAQGNFTFCLFSQDGVGILLDETGIKSGAVPNGLIVNDMVSDNANISGGKLDISSVVSEINGNTSTLKSSIIKFDDTGQTLQVAFNQLKNRVDTIEQVTIDGDLSSVIEQVNTNTTQIQVNLGKIETLITNTTITKENGNVVQLKDAYNSTANTVDAHTQKIGTLETNYNKLDGSVSSVISKQSALENTVDGFKQTVSSTYATNEKVDGIKIGGENLLLHTDMIDENITSYFSATNGAIIQRVQYNFGNNLNSDKFIKGDYILRHRYGITDAIANNYSYSMLKWNDNIVLEPNTEYTMSIWIYKGGNCSSANFQIYPVLDGGTLGSRVCHSPSITSYTGGFEKITKTFNTGSESTTFSVRIYNTYDTSKTSGNSEIYIYRPMLEKGNKASDYKPASGDMASAVSMNSAIEQKADSILSTVSNTYATKANLKTTDDKFANYSTTTQMNSAINQKADSITNTVSKTYATKTEVNAVDNKLSNYSTTSQMNSAINQKADEVLTTVSNSYATSNSVDDLANNLSTNYSTTTQMNSAIKAKADSITSTVSANYATKKSVDDIANDLSTNYSTTTQMNSAITQKANEINAKVSTVEKNSLTNYVNQVVNSNCLNSIQGWYTTTASRISQTLSSSKLLTDKHVVKLDCRENAPYMNSKKFPVAAGEQYTIGVYGYRKEGCGLLRVYLLFSDNDASDNNYFASPAEYIHFGTSDTAGSWIYKKKTFTVPEGASWAFVKVRAEAVNLGLEYDSYGYFSSLMCVKGDTDVTWTGNTNDSYNDLEGRVSTAEISIKDTITSTVRKDNVISMINQTPESINIKAEHIDLNGAVTIADSNGDKVRINDADYAIYNGSTTKGFFGLRTLNDTRKIPRLALSANGFSATESNYFSMNAYPGGGNNPEEASYSYLDMGYRCSAFQNPSTGASDASNIKMRGNGDIAITPIRDLHIYTNHYHGEYVDGAERLIATFGSAKSNLYDRYLAVPTVISNNDDSGLSLAHRNSSSNIAIVRLHVVTQSDGTAIKYFYPKTDGGDMRLGSPTYPWYRCYAKNAESVTSDRRLKENIEYIENTENTNATKSTSYTLDDMYNFVKDDLYLATYTMKDSPESGLKYGFIAQDIVSSKVGYNIVDQDNEKDYVGYDTMNYVNALAGALKKAISKIEELESKVEMLEQTIINKEDADK